MEPENQKTTPTLPPAAPAVSAPATPEPVQSLAQPPIQPAPPPELPKNKMPKKLVVFSAVLLFIAIVLVAFKLILKNKAAVQPAPSPTAATQPSPTLTPDPTADWKTCTNSKDGFSIKYPADFAFNTDTCNYAIADYNLVKDITTTTIADDVRKNWLLTINGEDSDLTVDQWIKNKDLCPKGFDSCSNQTNGPIKDSIQFNQINRHYAETETILKIENTIFEFSLNARNPDTPVDSDIQNIYNQILSTFKFMETTPSANPTPRSGR